MSDGAQRPPRPSPGAPGTPGTPRTSTSPGTPRTTTGAGVPRTATGTDMPRTATGTNMRVMTATREIPLPKSTPEGPLGKRLASGASDLALNAASVGRELLEDFRRSDRFFKYKVLIVAVWAVLSTTSMGIACQGAGDPTLDFGAKVVVLTGDRPAVMIRNMSDEPWLDVTLIVNRDYRASVARVDPGKDVTITPKQLLGPGGKVAPADLLFRDVVMRTEEGKATLVEDGKVPQ